MPHPKDMQNIDLLMLGVLKRSMVDWLLYHDAQGDLHKRWWKEADQFLRSGYYQEYIECSPDKLMALLEDKYKRGGYDKRSLEKTVDF